MRHLSTSTVLVIVAALALTLVAAGILTTSHKISNHVTLKAIGIDVFQDPQCTVDLTTLDWGLVDPGQTYYRTAFCKNTKNVPVTMVLSAQDFSPSTAEQYIKYAWNYSGQTLSSGQVIPVQFSLTIAANITGIETFSFTAVVTATEKTS